MGGAAIFGLVVLGIFALVIISKSVYVIRQYQRGVVATFGKYTRTADPGLTLVFPFVQSIIYVDMRETVLEVSPQTVITSDNAMLTVDAVIYFEVTDPFRNIYNVTDFRLAAIKLAQTNLRNIIGEMQIDEALVSRERINAQLRQIMDDATDKWGVRVTRVELQSIEPPRDITEAMSRQMKAERDKRAAILEAEGVKQSQILHAEGERQSRINRAEGEAEAIRKVAEAEKFRQRTVAEGEAQAIRTVFEAIHAGSPTPDLLAVKYLETLSRVANGKATKIFLPLEAVGMLGAMAAIGDAFKEGQTSLPLEPEQPAQPAQQQG